MIICAIDVGYGNTKCVVYNTLTNNLKSFLIPSIAGKVDEHEIATAFSKKRNVYTIKHEDQLYEIGEESIGNIVKITHGDYLKSKSWRLFFLAALKAINEPVIDLVVSGLPVYQFKKLKDEMSSIILGSHSVDDDLSVLIKNVEVIPQPLGALAAVIDERPELQNKNILLIDPGHHTFDWLSVIKASIRMELSGSHPEGVDALINSVIKKVEKTNDVTLSHKEVDESIRNGTFAVDVYGKPFSIKPFLDSAVSTQLETSIDALKNTLQSTHNISHILIGGGGAYLYFDVIKNAFPNHDVSIINDSAMANAKGYLRFGLAKAKSLK
jgi:plasmid segregation protein ParM